jgi:hypothetical protein
MPQCVINQTQRQLYFSILLWFYSPLLGIGRFLSFLILYTVGRTPWTGDRPVVRPLPTHRTTQTHNKRTQISMPRVGFETTIPVFQPAKTVHGLDPATPMIGQLIAFTVPKILIPDISLINLGFCSVKLHTQCVSLHETDFRQIMSSLTL